MLLDLFWVEISEQKRLVFDKRSIVKGCPVEDVPSFGSFVYVVVISKAYSSSDVKILTLKLDSL